MCPVELYGEVQSVSLVKDALSGNSCGFAFVNMPNPTDAQDAILSVNHSILGGHSLRVEEARKPHGGDALISGFRFARPAPGGFGTCDYSKLTQRETEAIADVEQQHNFAKCSSGADARNYSKLTESEAATLAVAEHRRNYKACLSGYGYCDRSRLTLIESGGLPNGPKTTPQ